MFELIKKELKQLVGRKIIVFFRYGHLDYNIKKSGLLIECDDKHFTVDERVDGRSTFSYEFVVQVMGDKSGEGKF